MSSKKENIASFLDKIYVGRILFNFSKSFYGRHIRVINYHTTPPAEAADFAKQLMFFQTHYSPVSYTDLIQFFETGEWHKDKPGLIISFDDGYRDNVDVAVPLLEQYGFIGWFFIPSGLIDASSDEQMEFVGKTSGRYKVTYSDGRYLMSWDEIRTLYAHHVVGCHTLTHHRMNEKDGDDLLRKEIIEAKYLMEQKLGKKISIYCWVGGEEHTYTKAAAKMIKEGGYLFSFMTNAFPLTSGQSPLHIQRTNIETRNSLSLVRFQLSVLMDLLYRSKRNRVTNLTKI